MNYKPAYNIHWPDERSLGQCGLNPKIWEFLLFQNTLLLLTLKLFWFDLIHSNTEKTYCSQWADFSAKIWSLFSLLNPELAEIICCVQQYLRLSWVRLLRPSFVWQPTFNFINFWPKLLSHCTLTQYLENCFYQCKSMYSVNR